MKIAIVSNTTWNIINFRIPLIQALIKEGHDVWVVSPSDQYIKILENENIPHLDISIDNKGINPLGDIKTFLRFFFCYKKHKFDLVFHYTIKPVIYGGIAAMLLRRTYISTITGLGTIFIKQSWVTRLASLMYRVSQKKALHVFFQNNDDRTLFLNKKLVLENIAKIVPGSGINTNHFCALKKSDSNKETFVFLLIARMLRDKGIYEYIEAARIINHSHKHVTFQLLGPVDVENNTAISQAIVDEWVDEGVVEYYSSVDDVRPYIEQSDCIVLPSYREGLPRTLLEAAAMGKPLIATDTAGCRDVVKDGVNGYLCKVADAKDLAAKLEQMISLSETSRANFGVASRQHVLDNFDENTVIDCYLTAISKFS